LPIRVEPHKRKASEAVSGNDATRVRSSSSDGYRSQSSFQPHSSSEGSGAEGSIPAPMKLLADPTGEGKFAAALPRPHSQARATDVTAGMRWELSELSQDESMCYNAMQKNWHSSLIVAVMWCKKQSLGTALSAAAQLVQTICPAANLEAALAALSEQPKTVNNW